MGKNTSKRKNGSGSGGKTRKKTSSPSSCPSPAGPNDTKKDLHVFSTMHNRRNMISILVLIIATILALVARQKYADGDTGGGGGISGITKNDEKEMKMHKFLTWIIDNGGRISPHVTLDIFPEYGGYGLMSVSPDNSLDTNESSSLQNSEEHHLSTTNIDETKEAAIIKHLDDMFTIPPSIITSVESILNKYSSAIPDIRKRLERSIRTNFPNLLEQQDVIIALYLMAECSLGEHSTFHPYLDVLPMDVVPRLDTFDESELIELQDEYLSSLARESKSRMKMGWSSDTSDGRGGRGGLKELAKLMASYAATTATSSSSGTIHLDQSCLTYDSFHRFTSIVSSRAMVLHGTKYLTPLADMINYAPQQPKKKKDPCQKPSSLSSVQSFTLYHQRDNKSGSGTSGSITARSDRDVFKSNVQIFEDYGSVDNSLFLEAHGFVPDENPSHCAVISPAHLSFGFMKEERDNEMNEEIVNVLRYLNILPPSPPEKMTPLNNVHDDAPIICVRPDGSISEELAVSYLVVLSLWQETREKISYKEKQRERCLDAIKRDDMDLAVMQCLRYTGWRDVLHDTARQSACSALKEAKTSLQFDLELLETLNGRKEISAEKMNEHTVTVTEAHVKRLNTTRGMIALKFRVAEKTILAEVCKGNDFCSTDEAKNNKNFDKDRNRSDNRSNDDTEHGGASATDESREKALEEFRAFIKSMDLPVNKIEPQYVGNGLRLGVVATENMNKGDTYLSIPDSRTINVDTIFRLISEQNGDKYKNGSAGDGMNKYLIQVLDKYRQNSPNSKNGSGDDGGFQIMLIYLLHERFVAQKESQWWPYLNILPTVAELKKSAPLFFDEEKLDCIEGSAVKARLVKYRKTAQRRFEFLSTDYDAVRAIGPEVMLDWDKFLWAYSILDSRSIWWDGKRNLVPLLDLVNCMELYMGEGSKRDPNAVHKTFIDENGENAVTVLSHPVKGGEQVYENYGQPNHIYFLYHGFILENNTHDCIPWDDVRIEKDDIAAANNKRQWTMQRLARGGFSSFEPSFCVKDSSSLHRVADFLRIKYGIDDDENLKGLGPDVNENIRNMLQKTLYRYDQIILLEGERSSIDKHENNQISDAERLMLGLVHDEREHFQTALVELNGGSHTNQQ